MRLRLAVALVFVMAVAACGPDAPEPALPPISAPASAAVEMPDVAPGVAPAASPPWIDFQGTSTLGFGILRLVPPPDGPATFTVRYRDTPDGYTMSDSAQLFVLPGDAFATGEMVYADRFLAFTRTAPREAAASGYADELHLAVDVVVDAETTVIVGYGPWTGPDVGRPSGDEHTFDLRVACDDAAGGHEWIESEAGELVTTNWTPRPNIDRGGPVTDPVTGEPLWLEVRPLILYDARFARAIDEAPAAPPGDGPLPVDLDAEAARHRADGDPALARDAEERAADLRAHIARSDLRIVLTPELMERFRRVPIRWR